MDILTETRKMAQLGATEITLPMVRLPEFLIAASQAGLPKSRQELDAMRRECLKGKIKVWGVPVTFSHQFVSISEQQWKQGKSRHLCALCDLDYSHPVHE